MLSLCHRSTILVQLCQGWGRLGGTAVARAQRPALGMELPAAGLAGRAGSQGRRGSRRVFACRGYTPPQPN